MSVRNPTNNRLHAVLTAGIAEQNRRAIAAPVPESSFSDKDVFAEFLNKCTEFHNYLVVSNVPKNSDCGMDNPKPSKSVLCSKDGYKMMVDMNEYSKKVLSPADLKKLEAQKLSTSETENALQEYGWSTIQGNTLEERVQFVQSLARAKELLSPHTDLCKYGEDQQIQINIFKYASKKRSTAAIQPRKASEFSENGFTRELMSTAEFVFLHPTEDGFVWLHRVRTEKEAAKLHLPWPPPDGQAEYMYLPLICSNFTGGGKFLMGVVAKLMALMKIDTLVFSALPHVVWYYFNTMGARFVNMKLQTVDVSNYAGHNPPIIPRSAGEASRRQLEFNQMKRAEVVQESRRRKK
jgi:hypothetical protein